ncbi:MAG: hypothetical protein ACE5K0_12735 [Candidatus Methanofastidiosia archaeon]
MLKIAREKKVDMIILRHKDKGLMESLVGRNVTEKILKNTKEKALVLD